MNNFVSHVEDPTYLIPQIVLMFRSHNVPAVKINSSVNCPSIINTHWYWTKEQTLKATGICFYRKTNLFCVNFVYRKIQMTQVYFNEPWQCFCFIVSRENSLFRWQDLIYFWRPGLWSEALVTVVDCRSWALSDCDLLTFSTLSV